MENFANNREVVPVSECNEKCSLMINGFGRCRKPATSVVIDLTGVHEWRCDSHRGRLQDGTTRGLKSDVVDVALLEPNKRIVDPIRLRLPR